MPVAPGVGHADVAVVVLDIGNDENFRVLGVTPLTENMDFELAEAPAEIDVLLWRQRLIAKQ